MRNSIIVLLICFIALTFFSTRSHAQSKYGKVTVDELNMTSYPQDSTAAAVILSKTGRTIFSYNDLTYSFQYEYTLEMKIKILKNEGMGQCTQEILYTELGSREKEEIRGLSGTTYNLENGKITKTKLSKEYIFNEEYDESLKRRKFTMPGAKVGSVIEFKYTIVSPFTYSLSDFGFQEYIPTAYAAYEIEIPEYFVYNIESQGYEEILSNSKPINIQFNIKYKDDNNRLQMYTDNCSALRRTFEGKGISAMKDEPYLWTTKDYISKISFELRSFQFKFNKQTQYSSTWEKIDNRILNSNSFGGNLKKESLFKNDVSIGDISTSNASAILSMVRSKAKWNDKSSYTPTNLSKVLKEGLGNSADINFLLINALKAAKFDAFPVILSTRGNGRIPFTHPSIVAFNYVITGVTIDNKIYYVDAANRYSFWNILPDKTMVNQARTLKKDASSWVDLSAISNGTEYTKVDYKFVDGKYEGKVNKTNRGNSAYDFRYYYFERYKDKDEYIENFAKRLACLVEDFNVENDTDISSDIKLSFSIKPDVSLGDEYLYINPMILKHYTDNPFKAEKRKFPINFDNREVYIQVVSIEIPEGYTVEELPKTEKFVFGDEGQISLTYHVEHVDSLVKLHYQYQLKSLFFTQLEYSDLRIFFSKIALKNSEQIVFKKVD